jgi:hypothetical protein
MQPTNQTEINSKISKSLLGRTRPRDSMRGDMARIAELVVRFNRGMQGQHQKDVETLAGLMRTLQSPRGPARNDVALFGEYVRGIVKEELSKRTD